MNPILKLLITYFLGMFGVHKFIEGNKKQGILYLCTLGLCGFGWLYDVVKEIINVVRYYTNKSNTLSNGNQIFADDGKMYTKLRNVTTDCLFVEGLNRQYAIEHLSPNTAVHLQECSADGHQIYLVVTDDNGIDLGEISYERSEILYNKYSDKNKIVKIKNITGGQKGYNFGCNVTIEIK